MIAPSENIEFFESDHFKSATAAAPKLRELVFRHLRSWPNAGIEFAKGVRELELKIQGGTYLAFVRRRKNKLGLMHLYELPRQAKEAAEIGAEIVRVFGR